MTSASSVVELRQAATDSEVRVITLLRKAKVIATKLQLPEALAWISSEIDGYPSEEGATLPAYRKLSGQLEGLNPYRGWEAVRISDPELAEMLCQAPIGQPFGSIEEGLQRPRGKGTYAFDMSPSNKAKILNGVVGANDIRLILNETSIIGIVDAVRDLILNWTLELEGRGIFGDGVNFDAAERKKAQMVTHQYFIQNAGVVGNVTDQATVSNHQTAQIALKLDDWRDALDQIQAALPSLPQPLQVSLTPVVSAIEVEVNLPRSDVSRLRDLAESAIRICEGAAGNLVAAGIGALLSKLLGF